MDENTGYIHTMKEQFHAKAEHSWFQTISVSLWKIGKVKIFTSNVQSLFYARFNSIRFVPSHPSAMGWHGKILHLEMCFFFELG